MRLAIALISLVLSALWFQAPAATYTVDPSGSGNALTIQAGIDLASAGDTVLVVPGIYSGVGNTSVDFGGRKLTLVSTGGCGVTTIDCGDTTRAFYLHSAEPMGTLVEGFAVINGHAEYGGAVRIRSNARPTFRNCAFRGNLATERGGAIAVGTGSALVGENLSFKDNISAGGGAIYTFESHLRLEDSTFTGNAAGGGGAIYLYYGYSAEITECEFVGNEATQYGGAVFDQATDPQISHCMFMENTVDGPGYAFGGGFFSNASSYAVVSECTFEQNAALGFIGFGGGLSIDASGVTVRSCSFEKNTALGDESGSGGGMYIWGEYDNWSPPATLEDCVLVDNASAQGGGLGCNDTAASISRCVFLRNESAVNTGGVHLSDYDGHFENCVVAGNTSAHFGGGIWVSRGSPLIRGVTIADNTAQRGGGIYVSTDGAPTLERVLIASNSSGVECYDDTGLPVLLCCDIFGNTGSDWTDCIADQLGENGNISADPQFCSSGVYEINEYSPCTAAQSGCGLIGALGVGCSFSTVGEMSWGSLKAMFR